MQHYLADGRLSFIDRLPFAMSRILLVGAGKGEAGLLLKQRPHVVVAGTETNAACRLRAVSALDVLHEGFFGAPTLAPPLPDQPFDAVVVLDIYQLFGGFELGLAALQACLAPNGWAIILLPQPLLHDPSFIESVDAAGFSLQSAPSLECGSADASECLCVLLHEGYSLFNHVLQLIKGGQPGCAYQLLESAAWAGIVQADAPELSTAKIVCLRYCGVLNPERRLEYLYRAYCLFSQAAQSAPHHPALFESMAEHWRAAGFDELGDRLMRVFEQSRQGSGIRTTPASSPLSRASSTAPSECYPESRIPKKKPFRVLCVLYPMPHYGIDVLYAGFCEVFGVDHVVDFPYKASLHGAILENYKQYPCNLNHPGRPRSMDEILTELRAGLYDLMIYADCELSIGRDGARELFLAARNIPVCIVDAMDSFVNLRSMIVEAADIPPDTVYFKREMLHQVDYGPWAYPLPFAYLDARVPDLVALPRETPVFWAGVRNFGTRRYYLEGLEQLLGKPFPNNLSQQEYAQALLNARIGINLAGAGFDTVRYWELPAHGTMMLSERLPIRIPHNFEDGKDALFFSDVWELTECLEHCLAHPEECSRIALSGRERLLRHHTASARALQCLACLRERFPGL